MTDTSYLAAAVVLAAGITLGLRVLAFAVRGAVARSAALSELGRWMPVGAVTILAVSCLAAIDLTGPGHGVDRVVAVVVTVVVHRWQRNALLSILLGTTTCVLLASLV